MIARNRVPCASQYSLGFAGLLAAALLGIAPASFAYAPQLQAQQQDAEAQDNGALQLAALIEAGSGPLIVEGISLDRAALLRIYRARDYQPIWQGRDDAATALSNALAGAGSDGIDPADARRRCRGGGARRPDNRAGGARGRADGCFRPLCLGAGAGPDRSAGDGFGLGLEAARLRCRAAARSHRQG